MNARYALFYNYDLSHLWAIYSFCNLRKGHLHYFVEKMKKIAHLIWNEKIYLFYFFTYCLGKKKGEKERRIQIWDFRILWCGYSGLEKLHSSKTRSEQKISVRSGSTFLLKSGVERHEVKHFNSPLPPNFKWKYFGNKK